LDVASSCIFNSGEALPCRMIKIALIRRLQTGTHKAHILLNIIARNLDVRCYLLDSYDKDVKNSLSRDTKLSTASVGKNSH
jgi:hypothetical protein